jgi:hypothetical protein
MISFGGEASTIDITNLEHTSTQMNYSISIALQFEHLCEKFSVLILNSEDMKCFTDTAKKAQQHLIPKCELSFLLNPHQMIKDIDDGHFEFDQDYIEKLGSAKVTKEKQMQ